MQKKHTGANTSPALCAEAETSAAASSSEAAASAGGARNIYAPKERKRQKKRKSTAAQRTGHTQTVGKITVKRTDEKKRKTAGVRHSGFSAYLIVFPAAHPAAGGVRPLCILSEILPEVPGRIPYIFPSQDG